MKSKSGGYRGIFGFFLKLHFRNFHRPLTNKEFAEQCITNFERRHGFPLPPEVQTRMREKISRLPEWKPGSLGALLRFNPQKKQSDPPQE